MNPDLLYDYRRQVSVALTACLLASAIVLPMQSLMRKHRDSEPPKQPPLTVELVAPEPPKPVPQTVAEARPQPQEKPPPSPRQPPPVAQPVRQEAVVPAETAPAPVQAETRPAVAAPAAKPVESPAHEVPQAPPPVVANLQADQRYEAVLRNYIESRKSYPTGRQVALEKPEGTAHMCLRLNRKGSLIEASMQGSSGSGLLDQAARRLLAGLSYPPFEEMAFRGQDEHEFCVHLKYEAPQG
jgi:periplasmic protein TonB